jgi:hypothetical protein
LSRTVKLRLDELRIRPISSPQFPLGQYTIQVYHVEQSSNRIQRQTANVLERAVVEAQLGAVRTVEARLDQ